MPEEFTFSDIGISGYEQTLSQSLTLVEFSAVEEDAEEDVPPATELLKINGTTSLA
jgi:hypothetical protein